MSSVRLFILSCFSEMGPMHGHRLRIEAERKRLPLWTDISVGAVYGAISRLSSEGLLAELRTEIEGNRPPRIVYAITDKGRQTLEALQREALETIWFRYDPFDLALSRTGTEDRASLHRTLKTRKAALEALLEKRSAITVDALHCVDAAQEWALRHSEYRLEGEIRFLADLIATLE